MPKVLDTIFSEVFLSFGKSSNTLVIGVVIGESDGGEPFLGFLEVLWIAVKGKCCVLGSGSLLEPCNSGTLKPRYPRIIVFTSEFIQTRKRVRIFQGTRHRPVIDVAAKVRITKKERIGASRYWF